MSSPPGFAGVFALPIMPFLADGAIDWASFDNEIDFCLAAKVHGLGIPLMAGEFYTLSDAERFQVAERTVRTVRGRCPVIIGVSGASAPIAAQFARHAREIGADGIIALPPYVVPDTAPGVLAYFRLLAESAAGIPIVYQNPSPPLGPVLSSESILNLAREIRSIEYVKEEALPSGPRISYLVDKGRGLIKGVFGGMGGKFILSELARGSCGIMPACHVPDVLVQVYERFKDGNVEGARGIYHDLLPLLMLDGSGMWLQNAKYVLVKRGVIKTDVMRVPSGTRLDTVDVGELEHALAKVQPWFRA
ncbi:MAG: dihydrodipicolinate synthase family protein [Bacteroidota bacterium]